MPVSEVYCDYKSKRFSYWLIQTTHSNFAGVALSCKHTWLEIMFKKACGFSVLRHTGKAAFCSIPRVKYTSHIVNYKL